MKNTWVIKLGFFTTSLIGSLFVLEVGMRLLGFHMLSSREAGFLQEKLKVEREQFLFQKGPAFQYRVVTLGDSSTNGGNVHLRDTYPFQLFKIQQATENKNKFNILNYGICEYNSYNTLQQITQNFHTYNPDIVILLSGEADRFNPVGLNEGEPDSSHGHLSWESTLYQFRIFKMARGIWLNWKFKKKTDRPFYPDYAGGATDLPTMMQNYDRIKRIANLKKNKWYEQADQVIESLEPKFRKSVKMEYRGDDPLHYYYVLLEDSELIGAAYINYLHQNKNAEAIRFLLMVLKDFPSAFFYRDSSLFYDMSVSFDFQSEIKASEIIKVFDDAVLHNPKVKESVNYKKYYQSFKDRDLYLKKVKAKRIENLRQIVSFLKKKGTHVIIQNYPGNWHESNLALKKVAEENGLPFVDNHAHFAPLMEAEGREKYLEDDEHPTPLGYQVMAQNVWKTLQSLDLK